MFLPLIFSWIAAARHVSFACRPCARDHLTVIAHIAFVPLPSFAVHVIVAFPAFFAVTFPVLLTAATDVSLLFHVTALFVAFVGETVTSSRSKQAPGVPIPAEARRRRQAEQFRRTTHLSR